MPNRKTSRRKATKSMRLIYIHKSGRRQEVTAFDVIKAAAEVVGCLVQQVSSAAVVRTPDVTRARHLSMCALSMRCIDAENRKPLSSRQIADILNVDHTAINKGIARMRLVVSKSSDCYDPEAIEQWESLHVCIGANSMDVNTAWINTVLGHKHDAAIERGWE